MYVEKHELTIITNAAGAGTGYTPVVKGQIVNVIYTKAASGHFDDGVTFAVTGEDSGVSIWSQAAVNASATVSPRQATHTTAGVAALYEAGGSAVLGPVCVPGERVKIAVTLGGNTKVGKFTVLVA